MKRILFNIFSLIMALWLTVGSATPVASSTLFERPLEPTTTIIETVPKETEPIVIETEPPVESYFKDIEYIEQNDKEHCLLQINNCEDYIKYLKSLDFKPQVEREIQRVKDIIELYNQKIIELEKQAKWNQKEEEYPVASQMWLYLTNDMGLNNYVAAGIIGNVMVETGGQTLDIEWNIYSNGKGYYGLCQWYIPYNPSMNGASFEEQCNYLNNSIEAEFDTFGSTCYQSGFDYEDFVQMEDVRAAALAFAKCYERCAATSYNYSSRQSCAEIAYSYFVD